MILGERCILESGHEDEHESDSYYWSGLPSIKARADQSNPFERQER